MRLQLAACAAIATALLWTTPAPAPVRVGNGGDDVRLLVTEARDFAVRRVQALLPCALTPTTPAPVRTWFLAHQAALADDLARSPHAWLEGDQPSGVPNTCARTEAGAAAATVTFAMAPCRQSIATYRGAGELLVHESAHHLGVTDEAFADQIARAVYDAELVPTCAASDVELAVGETFACARRGDLVECWGNDAMAAAVPALVHPRKLRAGRTFACALDDLGVACWGFDHDRYGEAPARVAGLLNPRDVSLGYAHGCALDDEGVKCWGMDHQGNLTLEGDPRLDSPRRLAAGFGFTCALQEGGILCSGSKEFSPTPQSTRPLDAAWDLAATPTTLCALLQGGVQCFGSRQVSYVRDGFGPGRVQLLATATGHDRACVAKRGQVRCMDESFARTRSFAGNLTALGTGYDFFCVVEDGAVKCWNDFDAQPKVIDLRPSPPPPGPSSAGPRSGSAPGR